ncbi:MAG: zf-HC2 domain-containing protein [Planctomycetes bacterium]|nr:zf-HC2 domain-containing protein [Planctomycetota bacterium]
MNCQEIQTELISFIKDECPKDEAASIARHVEICPSCRKVFMELRSLFSIVARETSCEPTRDINFETPAGLGESKALAPIASEEARKSESRRQAKVLATSYQECEIYSEDLVSFVLRGEHYPPDSEFIQHTRGCAHCKKEIDRIESTILTMVDAITVEPSKDFMKNLELRLPELSQRRVRRSAVKDYLARSKQPLARKIFGSLADSRAFVSGAKYGSGAVMVHAAMLFILGLLYMDNKVIVQDDKPSIQVDWTTSEVAYDISGDPEDRFIDRALTISREPIAREPSTDEGAIDDSQEPVVLSEDGDSAHFGNIDSRDSGSHGGFDIPDFAGLSDEISSGRLKYELERRKSDGWFAARYAMSDYSRLMLVRSRLGDVPVEFGMTEGRLDRITTEREQFIYGGMDYLAQVQHPDGSWQNDSFTTGLCVLALLSENYSSFQEDEDTLADSQRAYARAIKKGIEFLISRQSASSLGQYDGSIAGHAICTAAIIEDSFIGGKMTDARLASLKTAVERLVDSQNLVDVEESGRDLPDVGGWGSTTGRGSEFVSTLYAYIALSMATSERFSAEIEGENPAAEFAKIVERKSPNMFLNGARFVISRLNALNSRFIHDPERESESLAQGCGVLLASVIDSKLSVEADNPLARHSATLRGAMQVLAADVSKSEEQIVPDYWNLLVGTLGVSGTKTRGEFAKSYIAVHEILKEARQSTTGSWPYDRVVHSPSAVVRYREQATALSVLTLQSPCRYAF